MLSRVWVRNRKAGLSVAGHLPLNLKDVPCRLRTYSRRWKAPKNSSVITALRARRKRIQPAENSRIVSSGGVSANHRTAAAAA